MRNDETQFLYNVLRSDTSVESFIEGIRATLQRVSFPSIDEMLRDVQNTVYSLRGTYERLPEGARGNWIRAFKEHRTRISEFCASLIRESMISKVSNPVVRVYRSKILFFDGSEICEETIVPRSFWKLYRLIGYAGKTEDSSQLTEVLRVITTIASLCKDFALVGKQQDDDVLEQIDEISNLRGFSVIRNWEPVIDKTMNDIKFFVESHNLEDCPKHLRSFVATFIRYRESFSRPVLTPEVLKRSAASTGTTVNGKTVPGMLASLFENTNIGYDFQSFDEFTGYTRSVTWLPTPRGLRIRSLRNNSVAIPQNKDAMRIIHTLTNELHDRLCYFEKIHKDFLKMLPADCTFNQFKGRDSILRWSRDRSTKAIYSLDLHAATNTLSLDWQYRVMRWMLSLLGYQPDEIDILVGGWMHIMTLDTQIRLPYSRKVVRYKFASGQPMGFSDSFFSFAMLHHVVVLTVLSLFCNSERRLVGYHIVGDDFVIALSADPEGEFPVLYKDIMAFLNTECNLAKGYLYNDNIPGQELRIAEFCKFLICEGIDITPIPLGCLSQCHTTQGKLVLLGWLNTHLVNSSLTPRKVAEFCSMNTLERLAIELMVRMPYQNILNSRTGQFRINQGWSKLDVRLMFASSIVFLKDTFILRYLIEKNRDRQYVPSISDIRSFQRGNLRKLMNSVLSDQQGVMISKNKFLVWWKELQLTAAANDILVESLLDGVFPGEDIKELIPSLVYLEPETLIAIKQLVDSCTRIQEECSQEGGEYPDLIDDELEMKLFQLEGLSMIRIDSTNHRFGKLERISQGMDLESFAKEALELSLHLGVTEEMVNDFLQRVADDFSFSEHDQEMWKTEIFDQGLEFEDDPDDGEIPDPWSDLLD